MSDVELHIIRLMVSDELWDMTRGSRETREMRPALRHIIRNSVGLWEPHGGGYPLRRPINAKTPKMILDYRGLEKCPRARFFTSKS